MGKHLRKLYSTKEVKEIFERYLSREIGTEQALALMKIRRRQFFKLLKSYREKPSDFSLDYKRKAPPRTIDAKVETRIIKELKREKAIIEDKNNPVKFYNYSYLKTVLEEKHGVDVSLSTIIRRAKKLGITRKGFSENPTTGKS